MDPIVEAGPGWTSYYDHPIFQLLSLGQIHPCTNRSWTSVKMQTLMMLTDGQAAMCSSKTILIISCPVIHFIIRPHKKIVTEFILIFMFQFSVENMVVGTTMVLMQCMALSTFWSCDLTTLWITLHSWINESQQILILFGECEPGCQSKWWQTLWRRIN